MGQWAVLLTQSLCSGQTRIISVCLQSLSTFNTPQNIRTEFNVRHGTSDDNKLVTKGFIYVWSIHLILPTSITGCV